ncbi:MAG: energy transducer TonB [Sphingomonadaceae bacterium]|nr:energy transducer TonB [Sphingomonadaceae bacterium]
MKLKFFVLMSPILAIMPFQGAAGKDHDTELNVTAQHLTVQKWAERTGQKLSAKLAYPDHLTGPQEGIVYVKFACSDTGSPTGIDVLKSSGSRALDRAAMRGVSRIGTLHPLPVGLAPSQKYVATILFAKDQPSYFRQIRKLESAQDANNHWAYGGSQKLALGVGLLREDGTVAAMN